MDLPLIIFIGLVNYLVSVDQVTQLWHRQLQDVGTVALHHEVICFKIPSDAQVALEFGDVLEGLGSQLLLTRHIVVFILSHSIDSDTKESSILPAPEYDVQVFGEPVFESKA